MKLSIAFAIPFFGLAACAHAQTPPPAVSSTSLTSVSIPRETAPLGAPPTLLSEPSMASGAWASRFPDAARLLGAWVKEHHATASALAEWAETHPEKMHALVDWSASDVDDPLSVFLLTRRGWSDIRGLAERDPDGVGAFLAWVRNAPTAATNLDWQPQALAYAVRNADVLAHMDLEHEKAKEAEPLLWPRWTEGSAWESNAPGPATPP